MVADLCLEALAACVGLLLVTAASDVVASSWRGCLCRGEVAVEEGTADGSASVLQQAHLFSSALLQNFILQCIGKKSSGISSMYSQRCLQQRSSLLTRCVCAWPQVSLAAQLGFERCHGCQLLCLSLPSWPGCVCCPGTCSPQSLPLRDLQQLLRQGQSGIYAARRNFLNHALSQLPVSWLCELSSVHVPVVRSRLSRKRLATICDDRQCLHRCCTPLSA